MTLRPVASANSVVVEVVTPGGVLAELPVCGEPPEGHAGRERAGNPAVVCLLDADSWPDQAWMRQVAAEMNLAATAFAHSLPEKADADWTLRWFTPTVEAVCAGTPPWPPRTLCTATAEPSAPSGSAAEAES